MNQLKVGAVLNYLIIAINTVVGLAYTPLMLRCLGQNEYGIYSLVSSIIAYLTILDFGFGNAIIRYTAKFRAEKKQTEQWQMFGMFLCVYSLISIVAVIAGLGLYFNVDALFDRTMTAEDLSQARVMMLLLTANLAFTFPLSIFGAIITAYENYIFQRIISICRLILMYTVMVALLLCGYKAISLVVTTTVFNLAVLIINLVYCFRKLKINILFNKFDIAFIKEISVYSFWIFLNAIMDKIYWGTGQFVLGSLCGTIAVAIFSVAILLEQMYMQFSTAISSVLLPRVTAMVAKNTPDKDISDVFIRTGRMQCIVITFILSGFIIFGKSFIAFWAGIGYEQSYLITLIFFISLFIPLIQNTGIVILQARNQMKFRSLLYLGISVLSLIFQIILSKLMGPLGCAIAIGGALLLGQGLFMNIYYCKVQHIQICEFWKEIGKMMIIPAALTFLGLVSTHFVEYNSIGILVAGIIIFSIIYIPIIWRLSMNKSEREMIARPITAKFKH